MSDDDPPAAPGDGGPAALAQLPGPQLAALLGGVEIDELSTHDLVAAIQAVERQKAFDEAQQVRMPAALTMRDEYQRCTCPSDSDIAHVHRRTASPSPSNSPRTCPTHSKRYTPAASTTTKHA